MFLRQLQKLYFIRPTGVVLRSRTEMLRHRNRTTLSDSACRTPVCQGPTDEPVAARVLVRNILPPLPPRAPGEGAAPAHLPAGTHS